MERQLAGILRLIAHRGDLPAAMATLCRAVEGKVDGAHAAIHRFDPGAGRLRLLAAPDLPEDFALLPATAAARCACAAAASRNEPVAAAEGGDDPCWAPYAEPAAALGMRGCWAHLIRRAGGGVAGAIALFVHAPRAPEPQEAAILAEAAELAGLALEMHLAREERDETAERVMGLTANLPGMLFQWRIDDGGRIRLPFVSDGAASLVGCPPDALEADPDPFFRGLDVKHGEALTRLFPHSAATGEPIAQDVLYRHPQDGEKWLHVRSRPRAPAGSETVNDALALDISEHKKAELSLQRSRKEMNDHLIELERTPARQEMQSATLMETARELTAARDAAEEASRAKSQFLSNMSHELRTPLNAIIGFSEMIKEQTFGPIGSPKYRSYAMDIYESGRHLLEMINEILDLAKAESGRDSLKEEEFGADELIRSTIHILRSRAERERVALSATVPEPAPVMRADKRKMRQVLLNLLTNALKFTEAGGNVHINCWSQPASGIVFQVTDTGIGIALEDIPKALGLFGQVDNAFSRRHEGSGLGLPLSKMLVEMHGGSFDLQSKPGEGTTVTVRLPPDRIVTDAAPIAKAG